MKRENKRTGVFTRRALLVAGGQLAALGFLGARLYQVQVEEGARYSTLAEANRISSRLVSPPRGRLLDRFGVVVAGNRQNWRALLIAEQTSDVPATIEAFSRYVPLGDSERARIERDLRRHRRFIPIVLREFLSWEDMARIEVNAPELPGVLVDVGTTREYKFGPRLAHVAGYVAPPNDADVAVDTMLALPGMRVGRAGLERTHDAVLRGRAGAVQLEVNAVGRVIRELDRQEGTPGRDVTLTIDAALQESVLARLGEESASAVVMDARNGEVLAMATNPSFDPSLFNSGVSQAQWVEWTNNRRAPLINKAASGLYAPGSTYKMVVALAGLEAKAITVNDRVSCPGYLDYGDRRYHCWQKYGHGSMDLRGAIKNSCDVFFYEVARRTGIDKIAAMSNRFGLGVKLGIDLPGTRQGFVPTRAWRAGQGKLWNIGDTIVCGIGQGYLQLSPLALATMTARLATGRAVEPHLTRAIAGTAVPGGRAEDWPLLGLPERMLSVVREGMWAVVNEQGGTANIAKLEIPGVQFAGKTGSVQVRNVTREQREKGFKSENLPWELRPHALFVGYAPHDAPRYAVALVVEHGNAGSATAAPIARDIMADVMQRDPARRTEPPRVAVRS
ncbi:MAG: penicillin-binding protein 2 [Alphaproteobacteria bacterium]|nr:penicillin-binding protein 2 [Alphaproteobacteria bacterium]